MPTVIDDAIGWNLVNILSIAQEQVELTLGHVEASRRHFSGDGIDGIAQIKCDPLLGNRSAERVNVYEIMSKPVVTLPADMNIKYAVRLLVRFELSRALVVDAERRPVGIVTLRDMVLRYGAE